MLEFWTSGFFVSARSNPIIDHGNFKERPEAQIRHDQRILKANQIRHVHVAVLRNGPDFDHKSCF